MCWPVGSCAGRGAGTARAVAESAPPQPGVCSTARARGWSVSQRDHRRNVLCGMLVAAVVGGTRSTAGTDPPRKKVSFSNSRETANCRFTVCLVLVHVCLCLSDVFLFLSDVFLFTCQFWVSLCGTCTAGPS